MEIVMAVFLWWCIGVGGFIFWWTNEHDFTVSELVGAAIIGVMGPVSWVVGAAFHGRTSDRVLFKRRS